MQHRTRDLLMRQRMQVINALRGTFVLPRRAGQSQKYAFGFVGRIWTCWTNQDIETRIVPLPNSRYHTGSSSTSDGGFLLVHTRFTDAVQISS
jgi:hypothetical protein